jgi:hypothetical protein
MKVTLIASLSSGTLDYVNLKDLDSIEKLIPHLSFTQCDMSSMGYVNVGKVELEADLLSPDQIIGNAVVALRIEAKKLRAEASAKAGRLEAKAQQLLAIENGSAK